MVYLPPEDDFDKNVTENNQQFKYIIARWFIIAVSCGLAAFVFYAMFGDLL